MPLPVDEDTRQLLTLVRIKLGISQQEFGSILGVDRRTVLRREGRGAILLAEDWHKIARAVFPVDRELAERAARVGSATLESLELVKPAPPPVAPQEAPLVRPPGRKRPPAKLLVKGMLGVLCETLKTPREEVCRILLPALGYMDDLELEIREVVDVLEGREPPVRPGEPLGLPVPAAPRGKKRGSSSARKRPASKVAGDRVKKLPPSGGTT